jgi:hypothetical protein
MTDLEIINLAKILLSLDIQINNNGSIVFYKNSMKCIYTRKQFIEIFLEGIS